MRGAFLVGAMEPVRRLLGENYFDAIFATSVGVFVQAAFAARQQEMMEHTWREYIPGNRVVNFLNPLRGKPLFDLDYLLGLMQSDQSRLDLPALQNSQPKLFSFITDHESREPRLMDLKQGPIWEIMRATCAIPFFYPKKVMLEGKRYVDSWLAPKERFKNFIQKSLSDYDEVLAISAYPQDFFG